MEEMARDYHPINPNVNFHVQNQNGNNFRRQQKILNMVSHIQDSRSQLSGQIPQSNQPIWLSLVAFGNEHIPQPLPTQASKQDMSKVLAQQ